MVEHREYAPGDQPPATGSYKMLNGVDSLTGVRVKLAHKSRLHGPLVAFALRIQSRR